MRVQEYNTGSKFNELDMLFGSEYIEKGKFKSKNFRLKDILANIRSGLVTQEGSFSIQLITQESTDSATTPAQLINQSEEGVLVPSYGIVLVRMTGAADETYLFTLNSKEFGANAFQCTDADFILLNRNKTKASDITVGADMDYLPVTALSSQFAFNQEVDKRLKALSGQFEETGSFNVLKDHDSKTVFIETGGANQSVFIPTLIPAGFKATYVQVGHGIVSLTMGDNSNLYGKATIGGDGYSVTIIKRIKDNKIYVL